MDEIVKLMDNHNTYSNYEARFTRGQAITKLNQLFENFPKFRMAQILSTLVESNQGEKKTWNLTDKELLNKIDKTYKKFCKESEEEEMDFHDIYQD